MTKRIFSVLNKITPRFPMFSGFITISKAQRMIVSIIELNGNPEARVEVIAQNGSVREYPIYTKTYINFRTGDIGFSIINKSILQSDFLSINCLIE